MSNDNRTRIIRPQQEGSLDGKTRKVSDDLEPETQENNHTRVISGYGNAPATEKKDQVDDMIFELAVGWLVVIKGPGKGCSREIYYGMNSVGRGEDERIALDFGDNTISREAHAFVTFDEKQSKFYLSHGGKSNLVRLNDAPVLSAEPLSYGDRIEIGNTILMFVPLCGEAFSWEGLED